MQFLDIGRARTLAEGLELAKQKPNPPPEQPLDVQAVAGKLDGVILFYSLGPKIPGCGPSPLIIPVFSRFPDSRGSKRQVRISECHPEIE